MTIYHLYLTDKSTIEASIYEDRDGIYIGSMDLEPEDLEILLNFCQNTADAVILQLANKANQIFHNRNDKDIN